MNYENNFKLLYYRNIITCLSYGVIYGLLSAILSYLIITEKFFNNVIPNFINDKPILISIFIGLFIKQIMSIISIETKGKEFGVRMIPKFIDDIVKKRMNDIINKHYHTKSLPLINTLKVNKINNINNIIEESLPIQITSNKKRIYLNEFKMLKSNESKLTLLGYKFGEHVFEICEQKINEK